MDLFFEVKVKHLSSIGFFFQKKTIFHDPFLDPLHHLTTFLTILSRERHINGLLNLILNAFDIFFLRLNTWLPSCRSAFLSIPSNVWSYLLDYFMSFLAGRWTLIRLGNFIFDCLLTISDVSWEISAILAVIYSLFRGRWLFYDFYC